MRSIDIFRLAAFDANYFSLLSRTKARVDSLSHQLQSEDFVVLFKYDDRLSSFGLDDGHGLTGGEGKRVGPCQFAMLHFKIVPRLQVLGARDRFFCIRFLTSHGPDTVKHTKIALALDPCSCRPSAMGSFHITWVNPKRFFSSQDQLDENLSSSFRENADVMQPTLPNIVGPLLLG